MNNKWRLLVRTAAIAALFASASGGIRAELYINEIFFDPPGDAGDNTQEYIELRGTPGMSLTDHYLLFLENENVPQDTGNPGQVDLMFDLNGRQLSTTGFFSLRQRNQPYTSIPNSAVNVVNTGSGLGWGTIPTGNPGANNTVGAWSSNLYSTTPGRIENSGFTAMLIKVNPGGSPPMLGMLLDGNVDNDGNAATIHDGLDYPNGVPDLPGDMPAWTIVDSIGIFGEVTDPSGEGDQPGEAIYGRTYAKYNFGPEIPGQTYSWYENGVPTSVIFQPNITPEQTYIGLGYEIELISRWGNSTGETPGDWHITNITNEGLAGFVSIADGFRQSGHRHDDPEDDFVETNQFVPYGANLTNTIGAANYPLNLTQLPWDYNNNGVVDAGDYIVWRKTLSQTGTDLAADGNGSDEIDEDDYAFWAGRFGDVLGGFGAGGSYGSDGFSVPEPSCGNLMAVACCFGILFRREPR